jgi:linoleoyl-CoA desaturase
MSVVFQLAHSVEETQRGSAEQTRERRTTWAAHQIETTADFCPHNRFLTWSLGGLNYQVEHHLFPRLPHTLYPQIADIVRTAAERHGVPYSCQPSLWRAMRSHFRHLREMGRLGIAPELEMG